ncbi:MAG: M48 family metalloprotease [Proteobacteria bacterium]|nr:M48 family metalloprotease [Pseudomonadota bacterium]
MLFFLLVMLAGGMPRTALASFTIEDENKLGKEFYDKLEKGNFILKNERANTFLTFLGERILAHSDKAPFAFKFSIIRSSAINAFATPGGYVYVNQGLINLVENEGQLAGVLAHEIAHINGRHIAEIVDRSQKINISTLAAVLAGALLGGGGELTAAVTGFSVAAATSLSLKYSRQQEESADRMGLAYLVAAGYDGKSMLDFLKIMRNYEYYSNTIPSYFLTHPGTDERSRYIDALLQTTYHQGGADQIIGNLRRIQTILLLDGKPPDANIRHFLKALKDHPDDTDVLYGLAVTEEKLGMVTESLEHFRKAVRLAPDDPEILRDMGITLFKLGRFDEARKNLRRATELQRNDLNANLYLGKTLLALGDMQNALRLFKELEERRPDDPEIYYNLAMAYGKTGGAGDSHYYFGLYFKKKGKVESALFHFKAALKEFSQNHPKAKEIQKEIDSLIR